MRWHPYFAIVVEVVSYEEGPNGHSQLLVGPIDTTVPTISIRQYTQKNTSKVSSRLLKLFGQLRHQVHDQSPNYVIVNHSEETGRLHFNSKF